MELGNQEVGQSLLALTVVMVVEEGTEATGVVAM